MSERKGKFIVIEGIDGAGKGTQTSLMVARLRHEGHQVVTDDYPHYDSSFWGEHVGRMLRSEFGNPMWISPYLTALPYMLDEADGSRKIIEPALREGKLVVSNRYFTSNVHQIAKMPESEREVFAKWLWHAGYVQLGIARPDLVLVMLVDEHICRDNIYKKDMRAYTMGKKLDAAEADLDHQMQSAIEFKKMAHMEPERWALIECCRDGKQLLPGEIHELAVDEIKRRKVVK